MTTKTITMEMPDYVIEYIFDNDKQTLTILEIPEDGIERPEKVLRLSSDLNDFIFWLFYQLEEAEKSCKYLRKTVEDSKDIKKCELIKSQLDWLLSANSRNIEIVKTALDALEQ